MSSAHFVKLCRECGTIISQCRCPGPKETRYGVCRDCNKNKTNSIETAMKQYGLELDNSGHVDADALRFMRWTGNGWFVYTTGDHKEVEVYQGDDLGRALAALIGEQP